MNKTQLQKIDNLIASMYGLFTNDFICILKSKIESMENAITLSQYDKFTRAFEFIHGGLMNRSDNAGNYLSLTNTFEKMLKEIYLE